VPVFSHGEHLAGNKKNANDEPLAGATHRSDFFTLILYKKLLCLLSNASNFFLFGNPPPNPVNFPLLPITR
jgi:hypothetical protein